MKKLMIAAAIVCAAAYAQATAVSWGINGTVDATKFADATAYLINVTTLTKPTVTSWTDADATTWYKNNKTTIASAFRTADVSAGAVSVGPEDITEGGMNRFFLVIVDDNEKNIAISTTTKSLNFTTSAMSGTAKWEGTSQTSPQMKVFSMSVPEPTSGLLLVLGMAGLALRRRRA